MSAMSANLTLVFVAFVWGSGFIGQETAMDDIGPIIFCSLRFFIAGIALLPLAFYEQRKQLRLSLTRYTSTNHSILILGVIFFLGMVLQQIGLVFSSVTKTGFITSLYIIMVPLLLFLFWGKSISAIKWFCCILMLLGLFLLNDPEISSLNIGDYLVFVSTLFWALHIILVGIFVKHETQPITLACGQFFITAILAFIFHLFVGGSASFEPILNADALYKVLPELFFTALIAGALGFGLQIVAQRHADTTVCAIILSSEALFAALLAFLLLDEIMSTRIYIGCFIMFSSIVICQITDTVKFKAILSGKS